MKNPSENPSDRIYAIGVFLWTLAGILAVLTILALTGALWISARWKPEPPVPLTSEACSTAAEATAGEPASSAAPTGDDGTETVPTVLNLLLIGQDRRPGETQSRSDSMILCTLDRGRDRITLTSLLRDLYVPIPGHGENRLNAAYAFGGAELLEQTLEENFGVSVDGSVEVDFDRFSGIVDLMDGVALELREDEAREIARVTGIPTEPGLRTLDGAQALAYARIRRLDADADFSRSLRQRKLLSAMAEQARSLGLQRMLILAPKVLSSVITNIPRGWIFSVLPAFGDLLSQSELVSERIPPEGTYEDRTVRGMQVLVPDMEALRSLLQSVTGGAQVESTSVFSQKHPTFPCSYFGNSFHSFHS